MRSFAGKGRGEKLTGEVQIVTGDAERRALSFLPSTDFVL